MVRARTTCCATAEWRDVGITVVYKKVSQAWEGRMDLQKAVWYKRGGAHVHLTSGLRFLHLAPTGSSDTR